MQAHGTNLTRWVWFGLSSSWLFDIDGVVSRHRWCVSVCETKERENMGAFESVRDYVHAHFIYGWRIRRRVIERMADAHGWHIDDDIDLMMSQSECGCHGCVLSVMDWRESNGVAPCNI